MDAEKLMELADKLTDLSLGSILAVDHWGETESVPTYESVEQMRDLLVETLRAIAAKEPTHDR